MEDNSYLGDLNIFKNLLLGFEGPILGICSGMQIVGSLFEDKLVPGSDHQDKPDEEA